VSVLEQARRACGAAFSLVRRHRLFATLAVLSALIRALVWVAYQPGLFFFGDSFTYLGNSVGLKPNPIRPIGYPLFLHVLLLGHDIALVTAAQQLLGVITAGICYALLRRLGAGPVLASASAAPVLFDGYLIDIAQYIVAESLFMLLVMGGLALLVWRSRPSPAACAAAGALLGAAAVTRTVGLVLLLPALLYVVVRWVGVLRVVLLTVGFAVPVLGYAAAFDATWGQFSVTKHDGYFLYGRVSTFANCSNWNVPPAQRGLCFHGPPAQRHNPNYYVWHKWSGPAYHRHPFGLDSELRSFSLAAIEHEPGAYASTILGDLAHYASFGHWTNTFDTAFTHWRFPTTLDGPHLARTERSIARHGGTLALDRALVGPLRDYQRVIFLPGTAMAAILLASVAAAAIGRRPPARRLRGEAMLFGFTALLLPMTAAATTMFDYRYALPAIPPLCVAAGIAGLVAADRLRSRVDARPPAEAIAPAAPADPGAEPTTVTTIA
jgi:hypothetical protein